MQEIEFILYVADQAVSREFYRSVLGTEPRLDVPGMTEFQLGEQAVLGLMPLASIRKLLGDALGPVDSAPCAARCELYLPASDPAAMLRKAVDAGGRELSAEAMRSWGESVAYAADPDGHVLAFARREE